MDFDLAAKRLASDQSKLKKSRQPLEISAKAKREAELRKRVDADRFAQRERDRRQAEHIEQYFHQCERSLGVKRLSVLTATSIFGEGDKIALPPSVLELLASEMDLQSDSSPWTFRVAIPNPNYSFPASPVMQIMKPEESSNMDDSSDEEDGSSTNAAYLDELDHKYLAYSHATVVEFTQEEGNVGLPEPLANVLLETARRKAGDDISVMRTVDPAATKKDGDSEMDNDGEKTPGHLAWGAFDLPNMPIEVSLVKLPKGKAATLIPTKEAILNGFYKLEDIKLVLEQSLIRTRATLTVGDMVHSWHRGSRFDLKVSALKPSTYNAVVCLNTDLEVEFGENADVKEALDTQTVNTKGRVLSEATKQVPNVRFSGEKLPPEPPKDAEGVCVVQIRANGTQDRRRFDVNHATIKDLFVFACSFAAEGHFQLVTRHPRRVFTLSDSGMTLKEAGIASQELLMVERL